MLSVIVSVPEYDVGYAMAYHAKRFNVMVYRKIYFVLYTMQYVKSYFVIYAKLFPLFCDKKMPASLNRAMFVHCRCIAENRLFALFCFLVLNIISS